MKLAPAAEDLIMRDGIVTHRVIKLAGIAVVMAGLLAAPASAGVLSETLSYGPSSASPWTYTFAFASFAPPTATSHLVGVHLDVTGTMTTPGGVLDCMFGANGGVGTGQQHCGVTGYHQKSVFSLISPPLFAKTVNNLTVQQGQSYPAGSPLQVLEDDDFGAIFNGVTIAGATTTNTYNFYSKVVSSGGTVEAAEFTGVGPIDLTYTMTPDGRVDAGTTGTAALSLGSLLNPIVNSLSVTLTYDFVDTDEPPALALLGIAAVGIAVVRRRKQAA